MLRPAEEGDVEEAQGAVARGVTAKEFAQLCASHLRLQSRPIPLESTLEFLERSCALGLLRKEASPDGIRYFATEALDALPSISENKAVRSFTGS
jgi:hypothetical protein